jgi:sec-independent protein translocase protein TatC
MNNSQKRKKSDDLFEKSSMTFGEHLEDLRAAIAKSAIWVGVGLIAGFFFASSIVRYIQTPLELALTSYVENKEIKKHETLIGKPLSQEMKDWIIANDRISEDVYVDRDELHQVAGIVTQPPEPAAPTALEPQSKEKSLSETGSPVETPPSTADAANDKTVTKDAPPVKAEITTTEESSSIAASGVQGVLPKKSPDTKPTAATPSTSLPDPARLVSIRLWRAIKTNTEALSLQEPFMIWMKAAIIAGIVFGSPGIFWHIWGFVAAGLYPHERRYVYYFLPLSIGLFLAGAALAFFVIFQFVIRFLLSFNEGMGIGTTPRLTEYVSFALMLPLGFGIAFQLPLAMFVIERIGIMSIQSYLANWRIAVAVITFLSMILTPSEVISMIGMMVPLIGLYFFGIGLCYWFPKGRGIGIEGYDPA